MTGNERREKVLRSIFYPGAFAQDTKKAAKRKSLRLKKKVGIWKKNDFIWKVSLCVWRWSTFVLTYIDYISCMTFSLHALLKSQLHFTMTIKSTSDTLNIGHAIFYSLSRYLYKRSNKKTSHLIYVLLSRQRKDMNNSSNLHVFAGSYLYIYLNMGWNCWQQNYLIYLYSDNHNTPHSPTRLVPDTHLFMCISMKITDLIANI